MRERLCVVMPVYNEEEAIGGVLEKWSAALAALGLDFVIRPYNDGSKDSSLKVMRDFAAAHPDSHVEVREKKNGGHGHTILTGYREAAADGFDWVFQIDSDDEMGPEGFGELWARREDHDFLVGIRDGRVQALPRKVISFVSRLCVRIFYGKSVWDVNTPYRLMRISAFRDFFASVPLTIFAPNVLLTGLAARHGLRSHEIRVPQHNRTTGEVSIRKWKLLKAAAKSFAQTVAFGFLSANWLQRVRLLSLAALAGVALVSVAVGFLNGLRFIDFQWVPTRLLLERQNPYAYSLQKLLFQGCRVDANQVPSCLVLLLPLATLPLNAANVLWDLLNVLFTGFSVYFGYKLLIGRGQRQIDAFRYVIIVLLMLAGTPWRVLIGNGQHLMFSLAFFMAALYACEKGHRICGGVLLALCAFKYTTIAPMAFVFLFRREWMAIAVAALLHVLLTLGCGLWLNESPVALIVQSLQVGSQLLAQGDADLASLASKLQVGNVQLFALLGYVVWGVFLWVYAFTGKRDTVLKLAALAVISNVMFYHRIYDFVTLVFPLAYVMVHWQEEGRCERTVRVLTLWNVALVFFLSRVTGVCGAYVIVTFISQHALLAALLVHSYKGYDTCEAFAVKSPSGTRMFVR